MENKQVQEKEYRLLGHLVGIVATTLKISLIGAEVLFLKFEIALVMSVILMIISIWAYRKTKCRLYEIVAFVCIVNILVVGSLVIRDRELLPEIEYRAVTGK